jgi:GNAT superfamily N-acetyltransferase
MIRRLQAQETYSIRQRILRPGLPIEESRFAGDDDEGTIHLGAMREGELVCVASFLREAHAKFAGAVDPYRLRGMATLEAWQGRGAGAEVIFAGFALLLERDCALLWCNAREKAVRFYERLGLSIHSERFDLPGIGPHYVMACERSNFETTISRAARSR